MKLLIVTETESIHAARWVNQLKDTGWEVHVFQAVVENVGIHAECEFGVFHIPRPCPRPKALSVHFTLPEDVGLMDSLTRIEAKRPGVMQALHERYLENLVRNERPHIIHSLGLNINWTNMCLPVFRVKKGMREEFSCPWLYSSWGTDLSFYAQLSEKNLAGVRSVLKSCDYLITEHSDDRGRAGELGFTGAFAGYFTGFGGIGEELKKEPSQPASARRTILLKGRDIGDGDLVGRASTALRAFRLCRDVLKDYRIVVASASSSRFIMEEIARLAATTDLRVQSLPYLSSEDLMEIYSASRVFISLTVNDGIPRSLLEAMAFGAFPIFGNLDSLGGLISSGENGLLVPPEDCEAVAGALRKALTDDDMVDAAARRNREIIKRDFSDEVVRPRVLQMYEDLALGQRRTKEIEAEAKATTGKEMSILSKIVEQAIARHSETALSLVEKAVDSGRHGLLDLVGYAMELDDLRTWHVLAEAMERNDNRALRRLKRAMTQSDSRALGSVSTRFERIRTGLMRGFCKMMGREGVEGRRKSVGEK